MSRQEIHDTHLVHSPLSGECQMDLLDLVCEIRFIAPRPDKKNKGETMSADVIFEPLKWRNIEIKNKIFRSSISGRWDEWSGSLTSVRVIGKANAPAAG